MSGNGWEALLDIRELSREPPGWWGVVGSHYKYQGVVGRPSWMSGRCREDLSDIWQWS